MACCRVHKRSVMHRFRYPAPVRCDGAWRLRLMRLTRLKIFLRIESMKIIFLFMLLLFFQAEVFAETKRLPQPSLSKNQGRWLVIGSGDVCEVAAGGGEAYLINLESLKKANEKCGDILLGALREYACKKTIEISIDDPVSVYCGRRFVQEAGRLDRISPAPKIHHERVFYYFCMGCPEVVANHPSKYLRFGGLDSDGLYDAIRVAFKKHGFEVYGGNRDFGIISSGWRSVPQRRVGFSLWDAKVAIVIDFRFVNKSEKDFFINVQCYIKTKPVSGGWSGEAKIRDEACIAFEKEIYDQIRLRKGEIK